MGDENPSRSSRRADGSENPHDHIEEALSDDADGTRGAGSGSVSYLTLTRHIVFFVLFIASGIGALMYREDVMNHVGYGALPLGIWGTLFSYLLINRTGWLVSRYRETISSLVVVIGGVTVLGIFDAPLGSVTGDTMGGRLGEILAREPFDWHRYDLVLWHQILAWFRAGVLFAVGAAAQFPKAFGLTMKVIWIGGLMALSSSVGLLMMAGGAAANMATKRHKDNAGPDNSNEDSRIGPSAAQVILDEQPSYLNTMGTGAASSLNDHDFNGGLVVGMGDTIYAEEDDHQEAIVENPMTSPDEFDLLSARETVVHEPVVVEDVREDDGLGEFIEVGASLKSEFETEEEVVEFDEVVEPVSHQSVEEPLVADIGEIEPVVEETVSNTVGGSISEESEDVLEMITSGAAIEAAMNAFPWHLPPVEYLAAPPKGGVSTTEIKATSDLIEETLAEHGVSVSVDQVRVGPTVTMYGLKPGWKGGGPKSKSPAQRVRVDTILNREKDIALALSSPNIRFESVVAGSSFVGIEVPNAKPTPVNLRTVMDSSEWSEFAADSALPVPLGMGSGGDPVMADFSKMPHTLVAGATGSGKSVCMNTIVTGLLLTRTPLELRMVMIDPKRVELTPYQGIPHLYTPVIVEPERAVKALKALVKEMMDRFSTLEAAGVKNITSYNQKSNFKMPYLLILVDELADLMLTSSSEVEQLLVRLAQLGRATGVHLVVATQRPSVDVVTGLIKANFPSRISFAVGSQVDSRTILDATGADRLLGKGDMLYKPIDLSQPVRVQGAYLAEEEIESTVDFWKQVGSPPMPQLDVDGDSDDESLSIPGFTDDGGGDALFMQASSMAKSQKTLSTSLLQRRLRIGYPRAARLMDELEEAGIVGPGEPGKPRQVIANA